LGRRVGGGGDGGGSEQRGEDGEGSGVERDFERGGGGAEVVAAGGVEGRLAVELVTGGAVGLDGDALGLGVDELGGAGLAAEAAAEVPRDEGGEPAIGEEDDVEQAVGGVGGAGGVDAERVLAGVGDDGPAVLAVDDDAAVGFDAHGGGLVEDEFGEDVREVGEVGDAAAAVVGESVDDVGVEADGGHEEEGAFVADGDVDKRDVGGRVVGVDASEGVDKPLWVAGHAELASEKVFGAGGELVEGDAVFGGEGGEGVDGAVAADDGHGVLRAECGVFVGFDGGGADFDLLDGVAGGLESVVGGGGDAARLAFPGDGVEEQGEVHVVAGLSLGRVASAREEGAERGVEAGPRSVGVS